jgi:hypothetical protein
LASEFVYAIRDGGFAIHNGGAFYNRPLFGTPEPSLLMSGDQPEFVYLAPADAGKIGNLLLGVITNRGAKWLHEFADVESVYQPGWTRHLVEDPLMPGGQLEVGAVPLAGAEGFTVRLRWLRRTPEKVRLVWLFGGASGEGSGFRTPPLDKLHLAESDAAGNTVRIWGDTFALQSPGLKGRELLGRCDLTGTIDARRIHESLAGPEAAARAPVSTPAVAVFSGVWPAERERVHLQFVMNSVETSEQLSRDAGGTFERSLRYYRELAGRVRIKTPDPHFDLAVESMVIANDGIWRPPAFLHGATSWMIPYLGWRIWYGPEALGFHDRVRSAIQAFASLQFQGGEARGAIPDRLTSRGVFYNMNEVFLDHVYYHYLWTGDRAWLASMAPVIEGVLTWEKQKLDPDGNGLYESCLNTWISDSHWYNGGDTTQASAYMFRAHQLAAEAAEAAGRDPAPYRIEAERIRRAMNQKLWLAPRGHFAEFIDRIGLRRLHPEPELPSIYHPIEFGVTDPFQAYQMLRFTETTLKNERGLPNGGRLVWSSRWAPNTRESYTHSTYDLVFAEGLNLALAYYRAGQSEQAYDLIKGAYAPMYQGAIPGGIPCHAYVNGAQRRNEEFADTISMFARLAVEGVFGVLPEMQHGLIHVSPGFPAGWKEASIHTPDLSYTFRKTEAEVDLDVATARETRVHFRIPLPDAASAEAWVNGSRAEARLEAGMGRAFLDVTGPRGRRCTLRVVLKTRAVRWTAPAMVALGENLAIRVEGAPLAEFKDPQGVLGEVRKTEDAVSGVVRGPVGHHTLFVLAGDWKPIHVEVRPPFEIRDASADEISGACRFRLRNNTGRQLRRRARVEWAGAVGDLDLLVGAGAEQSFTAKGDAGGIRLGKNLLVVGDLAQYDVLHWPEHPSPQRRERWRTVSLDPFFNDSLATVLLRKFWTTEVPYAVCRDYSIQHLTLFGIRQRIPDDSRLRQGVDSRGVFTTRYGIPFAQRQQGPNMVALSRWPEFAKSVSIPVDAAARRVYLLLSALVFPMQSHIANARATVHYADGGTSAVDLENPRNFDNGWGQFGGTWHYAENGMELLSATGTRARTPLERTILEQHEIWKPVYQNAEDWEERPHADIVDVVCDAGRRIRSVEVEVLSQDIIVSLFGVTLLE